MGLFGLVTFKIEKRRKEISIRKVLLGQSAMQITVMLSREFVKLVLAAVIIALPVAYILTSDWLSNFEYRVPLSNLYFLGAAVVALIIVVVTVGGQAVSVVNKNPIKALREE